MEKVVNGYSGYVNKIEYVETQKMTMEDFLSLEVKPKIFLDGDVLCHIIDDLFCVSGIDHEAWAYHYLNDSHVFIVTSMYLSSAWIMENVFSIKESKENFKELPSNKLYSVKKTYLMIDSNTNLVKIGKSANPKIRESTLQSEKPTISLFAICDRDIEDVLHNKFWALRFRGEWFKLSMDTVLDIVNEYRFTIQK